jgi:hypothetical protein
MKKSKELEQEINKEKREDSEKDLEETSGEEFELPEDSEENSHNEKPEEELSKAEMNALIEEFTTRQNQRFLQFLRDSTSNQNISNDFLMKSLETDLDDAPKPRQPDEDKEELKYIKYESSEKSKYQSYSPIETQREKDPEFEKKSSSERILEEQKSFTKRSFGMKQFQEENSSGPEYLRPDDIKPDKARKYKVT